MARGRLEPAEVPRKPEQWTQELTRDHVPRYGREHDEAGQPQENGDEVPGSQTARSVVRGYDRHDDHDEARKQREQRDDQSELHAQAEPAAAPQRSPHGAARHQASVLRAEDRQERLLRHFDGAELLHAGLALLLLLE